MPTAGTPSGSRTATTSPPSRRRSTAARADDRPSLIAVRTHIGYGSPNKQDSQKAHGVTARARRGPPDQGGLRLGPGPERSTSPDERWPCFRAAIQDGEALVAEWEARFEAYARGAPRARGRVPAARSPASSPPGWDADLKTYETGSEVATRNASQDAIQALAGRVPELFGGAADLSESNLTDVKGEPDFSADDAGRNLRFGVREHAMGGIANGIAYHGGFIPYDATFLTFSDYMRGAVRLSALAGLHVIDVWTHDSVGLGEDGPTHQPVEHYAALRAIPNLWFVRPGDANETAAAWALAVERRDGPVALALTRQKLPTLPGHGRAGARGRRAAAGTSCARRAAGRPRAHPHRDRLGAAARRSRPPRRSRRTASRPASSRCPAGSASTCRTRPTATRCCRRRVRKRVSVEIGVSLGWERWVGDEGAIIGLDHFGASAPAGHDLRALRVHRGSRRRRRPAGRARGPARPDPDPRWRPLRALTRGALPAFADGGRHDVADRPRQREAREVDLGRVVARRRCRPPRSAPRGSPAGPPGARRRPCPSRTP